MSSQSNLPPENYPVFDWRLPQTTFFLVWFIFFTIVTIVSGVWYHIRRHLQPIKARLPLLNSVANIVCIFISALVCFNRILASTYPCQLDQLQGYIYLWLATIYAIRCWVLYFRFMWTQEVASCQDLMKMGSTLTGIGRHHRSTRNLGGTPGNTTLPSTTHSGKSLWYSRHLYLISAWFLSAIYVLCLVILLIAPVVAIATGNVIDHGGQTQARCEGISKGWETLVYMAYVCFYLYLAFRLATTFDYFHIKDELKTTALFVVPMFVLWIVSSFVFQDYPFPVSTVVSLCIIAFAQAMSTIYPLYLSFFQVPKLETHSNDVTSFEGLLRTENGFNSFKTFLEGEFAIENLLFFQTAEDYKEVAILTINHHLKDEQTGSRKDESSIKEGYLNKKGGAMNSMRRRYLVLKPGQLLVYAHKADQEEELRLDLNSGIKLRDTKLRPGVRPFEFSLTLAGEKKKHTFGPVDEKHKENWKHALKSAAKAERESDDEKEDSQEETQIPWAVRDGPRPLIGHNWRVELIAYALEIFFVYIEEDGFAQVNLSNPVMSQIAKVLNQSIDEKEKNRLASPSGAGASGVSSSSSPPQPAQLHIGMGDEDDLEGGVHLESSQTVPEEPQAIDMQSVVNLAARIEKSVEIERLPNLFSDAQEEIFNLMQSDSFRRYIRSHLYRDFVEKEKKQRADMEAMRTTALYAQE